MDEPKLGPTLRQAREGRSLSLEALAATTRIPQSTLEAMENDELSELPADVYMKGFVRAYCRAVALPEPAVLEMLERSLAVRRGAKGLPEGATPEEIGRPLMPVTPLGALGGRKLKVVGILLALLALALTVWFLR